MTRLPLRKPLLGKLPTPLITRADLRMALTAGLSAGLLISLGLPDPIYGPMAVGSVLGGTLGASRTLGIQRMQGTVLGGLIVMVGIPTMGSIVPLPIDGGLDNSSGGNFYMASRPFDRHLDWCALVMDCRELFLA